MTAAAGKLIRWHPAYRVVSHTRCMTSVNTSNVFLPVESIYYREHRHENDQQGVLRPTVSVGVHLPEDLLCPLLGCRLVLRHLHHRGHHLVDCLQREQIQAMMNPLIFKCKYMVYA